MAAVQEARDVAAADPREGPTRRPRGSGVGPRGEQSARCVHVLKALKSWNGPASVADIAANSETNVKTTRAWLNLLADEGVIDRAGVGESTRGVKPNLFKWPT